MATLTPNIGLKKPAGSEYPKISDAVNDNADILDTNIAKLQEGIAVIVDGDAAAVAVPVGGYAYLKNNEHGLPDGLYKNISSSVFPVSGGTANSNIFTAVPTGAVNDAVSAINGKIGNTALPTTAQTLTGAIAEHEQDITSQNDNIANLREGVAIVVDGDTTAIAVPVGGYAWIRNNTHGLSDGMYKNTSSAAFPASGGIANSTIFTAIPTGAINDAVSSIGTPVSWIPSSTGITFSEFVNFSYYVKIGKIVYLSCGFVCSKEIAPSEVIDIAVPSEVQPRYNFQTTFVPACITAAQNLYGRLYNEHLHIYNVAGKTLDANSMYQMFVIYPIE